MNQMEQRAGRLSALLGTKEEGGPASRGAPPGQSRELQGTPGATRHWLQGLHDELGATVTVLGCRRVYGDSARVRCLFDVHATLGLSGKVMGFLGVRTGPGYRPNPDDGTGLVSGVGHHYHTRTLPTEGGARSGL